MSNLTLSKATAQSEAVPGSEHTRIEQAAILLLSIGEEAAANVMKKFSREEVILISETMARLRGIKIVEAKLAINSFFEDYRDQSGINGASRTYLHTILQNALGGEIAKNVINGIYGDEIRFRMARLQWIDTLQLAALIEQEHLQLQAVFLAFLPPDVAAEVLSFLEPSRQDEVLYRITKLNDVNRDVIAELDRLVETGLAMLSEHGSKVVGLKRAANIMNRIPGNQQQMLDHLGERDESMVNALKNEMYEFFILSRQSSDTLQRIVEEITLNDWAVALKGTEPVLRAAIFGAMAKRQAQLLKSTIDRLGPVPVSRIEQVRKDIMAQVRDMAELGDIQIQLFAERTLE